MEEILIKVPAPFAGISDLGFTAQYPRSQPLPGPRDVPLLIEGPPRPMQRLADHLAVMRESAQARSEARGYSWSDPVVLSDEVLVIAFRDRSLQGPLLADGGRASQSYVFNLVRPVAFPFLQDCASLAGLRLADHIQIQVTDAHGSLVALAMRPDQIVHPNGQILL